MKVKLENLCRELQKQNKTAIVIFVFFVKLEG